MAKPEVLALRAESPTAVNQEPLVFDAKDTLPMAMLFVPEVFALSALRPIATLSVPVISVLVDPCKAPLPIAMLRMLAVVGLTNLYALLPIAIESLGI